MKFINFNQKFYNYFLIAIICITALTTNLNGQEQVSNVEFKSISTSTNINSKVGFALYNGVQYMIEEKDSVVISKYDGFTFIHHGTISNDKNWARIFTYIHPNRSLFDVKNQYYYRYSREGIEIINIEKGEIKEEFDLSKEGIIFLYPAEIHQNNIYFYGLSENIQKLYKLDLNSKIITPVALPVNTTLNFFYEELYIGIKDNNKIIFNNLSTGKDSILYQSSNQILFINNSLTDSTVWFVESNGNISKIHKNLNIESNLCTITNINKLKAINVEGYNAIAVYNNSNNGGDLNYNVEVMDLSNCVKEISFTTSQLNGYASNVSFVKNENQIGDLTVFGFYGFNPNDGFNAGLYYVIDHNKKTYIPIDQISYVTHYTPNINKNNLYFIGEYSSFWGSSYNIIKYDILKSTAVKLQPDPQFTPLFAKLGFPANDKVICSTNQNEEDPTVWALDENNLFNEIQKLDYQNNLGVDKVVSTAIFNNKIYFVTNGGLYSMDDYSVDEIVFKNEIIKPNNFYNVPIASYKNKIAIPLPTEDSEHFVIINTENNSREYIQDGLVKFNEFNFASGPFIFYSKGNTFDTLKALDLKTMSILKFPEVPYIISSWILRGEDKTVVLDRGKGNIIRIDNETNLTETFQMDMGYSGNYSAGSNNSFYFLNQRISPQKNQLKLLKENGEIETIYEGYASLFKNSFFNDMAYNIACLNDVGDSTVIIANNTEKTLRTAMVNTAYGNPLINYSKGKLLLKTADNTGEKFILYRLFMPLTTIDVPVHDRILYSDFKDDSTLVLFLAQGSDVKLYTYNINSNTNSFITIDKNGCDNIYFEKGIRLNSDEYLFRFSCDYDYEPWTFNFESMKFKPLKEINPGFLSSYPENFMRFEDYIYFTATKKDKSKQWFRVKGSLSSRIEELKNNFGNTFKLYPMPAMNEIKLNKDLTDIYIYATNGREILHKSEYLKGESIDLTTIQPGPYIIIGKDKNKEKVIGKFIKM